VDGELRLATFFQVPSNNNNYLDQAVQHRLKLPVLLFNFNCKPIFTMDSLSKDQKDEMATSFAALALYDGGVSDFHDNM
jgi:hypothetical protein